MRLGNITNQHTPGNLHSYGDGSGLDPSANANLLGNIMAWFHDMNPQNIALIPSATAEASSDAPASDETLKPEPHEGEPDVEKPEQNLHFLMKDNEELERPSLLELECVDGSDLPKTDADLEELHYSVDLGNPAPHESDCDPHPQPTELSSEWEEQEHLVWGRKQMHLLN